MGQTCSAVTKSTLYQTQEIIPGSFPKSHPIEWSADLNVSQETPNLQHKIPKASELKIKTLTDKNLQSQNLIRKGKDESDRVNGLDFFKQFATLKQMIQAMEKQGQQCKQERFQDRVKQEGDFLGCIIKNSQIGESINKLIVKQRVFSKISIKIQDFIRISEQPITEYYQFKQKIGQGSFGNVYRAICKVSKEQRAIKVLKKKQMSKQIKKQFLAQMQLLSKLDHPNIIKVYELYYYNYFYYVVTEYCKGGTILNYVNANSNYGEKFISKIIKQLLGALLYLHQNCVVHLDIKLENVVFLQKFTNQDDKLYIKLIDFGCSKYFVPFKKKKAKIAGTLSYIAPQCIQGYYSQKCDIWSTGVLLYILLSGQSPFKGYNSKQTIKNIQTKELSLQGKHWQKVSQSAKELITLMLNRNSMKRISARKCLQHKWFDNMRGTKSMIMSEQVIYNLQKYYRGNNFVTIIQTFISLRKINQQQRKRLTDIFMALDSDNSGSIQLTQLQQVYKMQFGHHDVAQIQHIIDKIDLNKSSSINFNQFLVAMSDRKQMFQEEHLCEAFNYFDQDKTGFIEKNQLKEILKGCEKEEFQYILKELDDDGDQRVSKEEFINYLKKF